MKIKKNGTTINLTESDIKKLIKKINPETLNEGTRRGATHFNNWVNKNKGLKGKTSFEVGNDGTLLLANVGNGLRLDCPKCKPSPSPGDIMK